MSKLFLQGRLFTQALRTRLFYYHNVRSVSTRGSPSKVVQQAKPIRNSEVPVPVRGPRDHSSKELRTEIMHSLYRYHQRPIPTHKANVVLTNCPHCLNVRKKSFAAYVDLVRGSYHCNTCENGGSWNQFIKSLHKKLGETDKSFEIAPASSFLSSRSIQFSQPLEQIQKFPDALSQNKTLLDKLFKEYKIKPEIWGAYRVGVAKYTSLDERLAAAKSDKSIDVGAECLTFPQTTLTFAPEKDGNEAGDSFRVDIARIKACAMNAPDKLTAYDPVIQNDDFSAGLFGYHLAPADSDKIILTRRELDAMAVYQETGVPCVALPTTNYQLQESVLPLLERFSQIYVWLDDDVEGQLSAERFIKKFGEARCRIVNTRLGKPTGPLNAHDALMANQDLSNILKSARQLKHDQIADFHDLREEVYREILNPEQTSGVQSKDLPAINKVLKGHRSGELTILTGPTGAGKTTVISQLSLDYCKSGVPTLWGSFEIQNKRLAKKMLYQFAGKDLSKSPKEIDLWADKFEQLPLYFLKFFSSTAIKDVLLACKHAVYAYDVRHIILDNLQFMLSQQGKSSLDRWELQDEAVAELRKFATQQDVHISLVVHPRKDTSDQLDINSVFGSAKVTQESDNVIIIQKNDELDVRYLDIKKNRFDGTLGSIPYKFMPESLRIRSYNESEVTSLERRMESHKPSFDRKPYGSQSYASAQHRPRPYGGQSNDRWQKPASPTPYKKPVTHPAANKTGSRYSQQQILSVKKSA